MIAKSGAIILIKPNNNSVLDTKPKMINIMQPVEQEQMYSITISAGMYLGIPDITYPTTQTFNSSKTS